MLFAATPHAQRIEKPASLGFSFGLIDFKTPAEIKATSFSKKLKNGQWSNIAQRMDPSWQINFSKALVPKLDYSFNYTGAFLNYPGLPTSHTLYSGINALLHAKAFQEKRVLNPYLTAGMEGFNYNGNFGANIPVGVGLQVNLSNEVYMQLQAQYKLANTDNAQDHLYYSFGILQALKKVKEIAPPVVIPPPAPKDTDKDGVIDSLDACPTVPGPASLNGCPDTDGDGILDKDDACPDKKGTIKYKGCPVPDTDGDGINDDEDKCPSVSGLARYGGCPIPDTDGDGINDEEDKCPTVPGVAENFGCPKIDEVVVQKVEYAAKNIYFATGKYPLLSKSFNPLNEVVKIMAEHPELKLDISGHTDNTGDAVKNQALSENRAKAVLDYLVKKGVAANRITSAGYGQHQPVAENKTAAGKAKNRRVEIKVRNY
ncbi:MAG: OmpA family protein [Sphingobacteriales bacterium]|nr:OmpA family protein [Sphingobacteriales bacterium]